jgi:hypothetical protein
MKRIKFLVTAACAWSVLFLAGCQNEGAQLTSPDDGLAVTDTPVLVELPGGADLAKALYDQDTITKTRGGDLTVSYVSLLPLYQVYMNVHFDAGSVSDDFTASLSTDTQYLTTNMALTFGPHGTDFLKPAKLTIKASGLNLTAFKMFDTNKDGIVYLSLYYTSTTSGVWQKMTGVVKINWILGTLEANDVQLPHFSRYAFGV